MVEFEVGAYFYPLTVRCPERQYAAKRMSHLLGLSEEFEIIDETLLTQQAKPLFNGHVQPVTYCLDESTTQWDDSDPLSMEAQICLAQDAGLDFYVFDSYEGTKNGRQTVESAEPVNLFRQIALGGAMKYAKMQTFASPRVVLPVTKLAGLPEPGRCYDMGDDSIHFMVDNCATQDWVHPNYLQIDGRPYLSLFIPDLTPGWVASKDTLVRLVDEIRTYSEKKYGLSPYLAMSVRSHNQAMDATEAGVDGLTGYAFLPDFEAGAPSIQHYSELLARRKIDWVEISRLAPFIPPAVVGWDATPRGKSILHDGEAKHNHAPIVVGSSPENFELMMRDCLAFASNAPEKERYGIICAWNEVTEGAALLPKFDKTSGMDRSYLDVVKKVLARAAL